MTNKYAPAGGVHLPAEALDVMRVALPAMADKTVAAVIEEVPSYAGAWQGPMGETIRQAVRLALGGFLNLAASSTNPHPGTPTSAAVEAAYQLGRGEARSGRTVEALLSAYRIGARVAWRDMSRTAVEARLEPEVIAAFAELVFAYIDELSAGSVAGHTDELATSGRVRQRLLDRLVGLLLESANVEVCVSAAARAEWEPPDTLVAVLVPEAHVRRALDASGPRAIQWSDEVPGLAGCALVLAHGSDRSRILGALATVPAVVGPSRPWHQVSASYDRARRAHGTSPALIDTELTLASLVLNADAEARADLRARVLRPLAGLRPSAAEKLTETLRSWVVHHGRRDEMAAALFVHPQTVRYRMGQLRELYGDALEDPQTIVELTVALA